MRDRIVHLPLPRAGFVWYLLPVTRPVSVLLLLCFVVSMPVRVHAAGPAPEEVEARAEALFTEGKFLEAADVWTNALKSVPEASESRGQRNSWAIGAVNAYKRAFEKFKTQCSVIVDGISLADNYLGGLVSEYGQQVTDSDDYAGMSDKRAQLEQIRVEHGCPGPGNADTTSPAPAAVAPSDGSDAPAASDTTQAPRSTSTRGLAIGTGVSASLMVGMVIGSLATYLPRRSPDGAAYSAIYDAAVDAMIPSDKDTDLCVAGKEVSEVAAACREWSSLKQKTIAMTVLAGVFAVSTAVFAGLLVTKRRQAGRATALLRRHQAHLGAAPQRGGATFAAGFRF